MVIEYTYRNNGLIFCYMISYQAHLIIASSLAGMPVKAMESQQSNEITSGR